MLMSYGATAHNNSTMKLKYIQLEAGRIVTDATNLVEKDKFYKELGWLKLSERKDLHKLFLFFKMNHGLSPPYIQSDIS